MGKLATSFQDLDVYKTAIDAAMAIFEVSGTFPDREKFSLTDQVRRSSRSVCANIAEAWRKRRYKAAFIAKLSDAESEAAETEVWLELAERCGYLQSSKRSELTDRYEKIAAQLINMVNGADKWVVQPRATSDGDTSAR